MVSSVESVCAAPHFDEGGAVFSLRPFIPLISAAMLLDSETSTWASTESIGANSSARSRHLIASRRGCCVSVVFSLFGKGYLPVMGNNFVEIKESKEDQANAIPQINLPESLRVTGVCPICLLSLFPGRCVMLLDIGLRAS